MEFTFSNQIMELFMGGLYFSFGGFLGPCHPWNFCIFFFFFSGVSVATCMAILHVGSAQQVRTGSTSSKEDDYESDAATIVQKCVSQASGHMGALIVQMRVYGQFFLIEERTWSTLHTLSPWVIGLRVRHSACLLDRLVDPAENTATLWWHWTL